MANPRSIREALSQPMPARPGMPSTVVARNAKTGKEERTGYTWIRSRADDGTPVWDIRPNNW